MRFSIRDILFATVVIAIVALCFVSQRNLQELRTRLVSQEETNAAAHAEHVKLLKERDFVRAEIDRSFQVEELAKQFESHFRSLQSKYSGIEPRGGATVSVRQIPMICDRQTGARVSRLRLYVPAERTVFLKYGIASRETGKQSRSPAIETRWETHADFQELGVFFNGRTIEEKLRIERGTNWQAITDYSEPGPFECPLQIGISDVDWCVSWNSNGHWETRLSLNQQPLLTTVLQIKNNDSFNTSSTILSNEQLDFASGVRLPDLFTSSSSSSSFRIFVWLDETSSNFGVFPRVVELHK